MSDIDCPYCGHSQEANDDCYAPDELYEAECQNDECEKIFGYTIEYYPRYWECKLDCRNGSPHRYKKYPYEDEGLGEPYYYGQYKCRDCEQLHCDWRERLEKMEAFVPEKESHKKWLETNLEYTRKKVKELDDREYEKHKKYGELRHEHELD